ncbi:MAG TPA: hypothetical protein PLC99_06675 [Verrucomicrobiota bacterium]|nr:hypothetical protein [Verrucomicrobiota bacterium]
MNHARQFTRPDATVAIVSLHVLKPDMLVLLQVSAGHVMVRIAQTQFRRTPEAAASSRHRRKEESSWFQEGIGVECAW